METAYVLSVATEKIVVIIPRFGIEGTILLQPLATAFAEAAQAQSNKQSNTKATTKAKNQAGMVEGVVNYDMIRHSVEIVLLEPQSSASSSSSSSASSTSTSLSSRKKGNGGDGSSTGGTVMDVEEVGGGNGRSVWRIQVFQPMQVGYPSASGSTRGAQISHPYTNLTLKR